MGRVLGHISDFVVETARLFVEMAPYLLLGLTVAGALSVILKKGFVARHVGTRGFGSILKAALLGVPLPLCSCGVIPTASYLRRAGASRPALLSFLISTPQTGVDSITATYGMLGPLFAVFRPAAALVAGVLGGSASALVDRTSAEQSGSEIASLSGPRSVGGDDEPAGLRAKLRSFARYAYRESVEDIALRFVIGVAIAALIGLLVPDDYFSGTVFGSGLPGMLLMVAVGVPMYVCSTSSIPIALALIAKGMSPGAAYVFLVAGPATNAASLAILARVLGPRQTVVYVTTIVVTALAFGPLMDALSTRLAWAAPLSSAAHLHDHGFSWLDYSAAAALAALLLLALWTRYAPVGRPIRPSATSRTTSPRTDAPAAVDDLVTLQVRGMTCHHCEATVKDALTAVSGGGEVSIDLKTGVVSVTGGSATDADLAAAVRGAGYQVAT